MIIREKKIGQIFWKNTNIVFLFIALIFLKFYFSILYVLYILAISYRSSIKIELIDDILTISNTFNNAFSKSKMFSIDKIETVEIHFFDKFALYTNVIVKLNNTKINLGSNVNLLELEKLHTDFQSILESDVKIFYPASASS